VAIEVRPVSGYDDLALWVDLRNAAAPDDPETVEMMALVRARELHRMDLLAFLDDEPAGAAFLAGDPASVASSHPYVDIRVAEHLRGRGVGTALVAALAEGARSQGKQGFECSVLGTDEHSLGYVDRRGYKKIRTVDKWTLDLRGEVPAYSTPPGIEIGWLAERPELMNAMYEVAAEAYPEFGGWIGSQVETEQDWLLYELGNPALPVELTSIAVAGDEVAGFSTFIRLPDGLTASHRMVAVARAWRGRGIARGLVCSQLHGAKAAGYETMVAWRRGSAPDRAFTRLGFERGYSWIVFIGPFP
jgi:ribosomal-protein-alanine N-acetyltransferase